MPQKVLIISFSNLSKDPRVSRQIRFLSKRYKVIAAGTSEPGAKDVEYVQCENPLGIYEMAKAVALLPLKAYEKYYWGLNGMISLYQRLSLIRPDLVIANDIESLPLALKLADNARVILDAHEYSPRQFEDLWLWRVFFQSFKEYLCREYIPGVDGMITVCQGIAEEYEKNYGVKSVVVTNAPPYKDLKPNATNPENIRMIYHGNANPSRKIENMIQMMDYMDERFELDLLLVIAPRGKHYMNKLKNIAKSRPRVRILPPVPMRELVDFSNQYDIGLYLLEPNSFNNMHALPNKFFEFIQSRLALAIGPSPEMARIVKENDCGVVADNFSPKTLAGRLMELDSKKIDYYKERSHKIARIMSAEQNEEKILKLVDQVLNQR